MRKFISFFDTIKQKPWEENQKEIDNLHPGKAFNINDKFLGLTTIIIVSSVFFSIFLHSAHYREAADWVNIPEPIILWFNTFVLILCSYNFYNLNKSGQQKNFDKTKKYIFQSYFLTILFVIGQLIAWIKFIKMGHFISSSPGVSYFYLLTALHVIHLAGGMFFLEKTRKKIFTNNYKIEEIQSNVRICEIYWHFLLLVWLIIFVFILTH